MRSLHSPPQRTGVISAGLLFALLILWGSWALAQPAAPPTSAAPANGAPAAEKDVAKPEDAQNPAPINDWSVDAGYLIGLRKSVEDKLYYRVEYKGNLLSQKGTPLSEAKIGDPLKPPDPASPGGDSSAFSFYLERGQGKVSNVIADALGVKPISIPWLRNLRGAVRVSGTLDGDNLNVAAGLETRPIHPLYFVNSRTVTVVGTDGTMTSQRVGTSASITNWLVFGLSDEAQNLSSGSGQSKDVGLLTYRAFIGRGFGWVRSDSHRPDAVVAAAVLKAAPTFDKALEVDKQVGETCNQHKTPDFTLSCVSEAVDEVWTEAVKRETDEAAVRERVWGIADSYPKAKKVVTDDFRKEAATEGNAQKKRADDIVIKLADAPAATWDVLWKQRVEVFKSMRIVPDQPTAALWLESEGWFTFAGDAIAGDRYHNLLAATAKWWLQPKKADGGGWLKLRYELGRERATPDTYLDSLAVSCGLNF